MKVEVRSYRQEDSLMDVELGPPEHRALLASLLFVLDSVETDRQAGFAFGDTAQEITLQTDESGLDAAVTLGDIDPGKMTVLSLALGAYAVHAEFITQTLNPRKNSEHPDLQSYATHGPVAHGLSDQMATQAVEVLTINPN